MNDRRAIARTAMAAALRTRLFVGYRLDHAVCVYDLAEKLGVEVRFLDLPSMEGMYSSASGPTIIVSSLRPPGRRAFTCAHELGHHNRSDGVEIDELVEQWDKPRFFLPVASSSARRCSTCSWTALAAASASRCRRSLASFRRLRRSVRPPSPSGSSSPRRSGP